MRPSFNRGLMREFRGFALRDVRGASFEPPRYGYALSRPDRRSRLHSSVNVPPPARPSRSSGATENPPPEVPSEAPFPRDRAAPSTPGSALTPGMENDVAGGWRAYSPPATPQLEPEPELAPFGETPANRATSAPMSSEGPTRPLPIERSSRSLNAPPPPAPPPCFPNSPLSSATVPPPCRNAAATRRPVGRPPDRRRRRPRPARGCTPTSTASCR